ncbi:Ger(x)C family spore germination protein [Ureibacillus sp. FSL E2-3493]|uniref:Ger(x)C family spore germination protein n=2 Tax=unclassified Ureibacillus TaxID=2638520 RepID=UPI00311A5462
MNKKLLIILILLFSPILTACWDRYELEERANILGLSIDIAERESDTPELSYSEDKFPGGEQNALYRVTAQLAVPGKIKLGPEGVGGDGSGQTAWVLETVGHTLDDAMSNLQQQLAEKLYLGHLQIVIVNDEVAREGMDIINDFLKRNYEVRRTAWMVISEDVASDVLEAAPPIETVPALYLSETLENAARLGQLPTEYLGKFWVDLEEEGVDAKLPLVKVLEKERILINGLAFFNGEKMVGTMTPIEIGAYLAMREKNPGGYPIAVSSKDGEVYLVESLKRDSKIKVNVKNGQPKAFIDVEIDSSIDEEIGANDLSKQKVDELEQEASRVAGERFEETLKKWQEKESDILGGTDHHF